MAYIRCEKHDILVREKAWKKEGCPVCNARAKIGDLEDRLKAALMRPQWKRRQK